MVYKDECVYCFDTVESPQGIDVCLECNYGLSPASGFTTLHTSLTGHDSFLNIRKTALERRTKQMKLAIDSETDADLWETHTKIIPGRLGEAEAGIRAKQVLEADSYNKQQEIVAWELEIQPCEHTLTVNPSPEPVNTGHCSQCELDNNLWLCLTCGCLSCGRPQYGGGGGNGHALDHFSSQQHPVAVKLGSITADGKADVFCYACDEDVKDPQIKDHLAVFGIEIASLSKTEKSMAELQLEQNAKFDFSMTDAQGEELKPVEGPGLTGMRNLGNTCYLNSVAQCLFALPGFSAAFPSNSPVTVQDIKDPPNDLFCQLAKLQDGLNSGRYATPDPHSEYQRGLAPMMLKHLVGKNHPEFATMRQQDAYEFLSWLLSKITEFASTRGLSDPVAPLFGYETTRRTQCNTCKATKYAVQEEESLSIQVPIERTQDSSFKPVSFDQLLEVETAQEQVSLDCTVCHSKQLMTTKYGFKSYPKVFVLNVRRFELVNWVPNKVDVPVQVPEEIDLSQYLIEAQPGEKEMPEEGFTPARDQLDQLVAMGFPYEKCVMALEATDNGGAEVAMNWLFQPEDQQVVKSKKKSSADPEQISILTSMGFTVVQAEAALKVNGNVESAIEWLFAGHSEDAEKYLEDTPACPKGDLNGSKYRLKGIVCHKGGSVHAGHYVAFVNRGGKWFLFNDEKVVEGADIDEMRRFAYLYIFERI